MKRWEARVCPQCGHEAHPREDKGERVCEVPCHRCGGEMVTLRLVPASGERAHLKREQLKRRARRAA